jgi:hypothetical protein
MCSVASRMTFEACRLFEKIIQNRWGERLTAYHLASLRFEWLFHHSAKGLRYSLHARVENHRVKL